MPIRPFIPVVDSEGRPGVMPNLVKGCVRSFWIPPEEGRTSTLAGNASTELTFLVDYQGHFDWAYIVGQSTGAYLLEFFDPAHQRRLSNKPIHSTTIVGSARRPFRLPETYFVNVGNSQRVITCRITDITGTQNVIELVLYGRRFYHKEAPADVALEIQRKYAETLSYYAYFLAPREAGEGAANPLLGAVTVPASATRTYTFDMDNDAHTVLKKLMAVADGAFTFRFRDRDTNRYLSNGVIHQLDGFGNAEFPFIFADPYLLEANKQLLIDVTDLSAAENDIYFTLAGNRLDFLGGA